MENELSSCPIRNRSRSEWQRLVDEYDSSEIYRSKSSYSRKVRISTSCFCKWHKLLSKKSPNFIKVPLESRYQPKHFWVKLFGVKLIRLELDV